MLGVRAEHLNGYIDVLPEVENEGVLKLFINQFGPISRELRVAIELGIEKQRSEPEKFRLAPKLHWYRAKQVVWPVPWQVFLATEKISDLFVPLGISIGLLSKDNKVIAIQRSLKKRSCKGFLGTPAGFMTLPYVDFSKRILPNQVNLMAEIKRNIEDQMSHELGLQSGEYNWRVIELMAVDYPSNRQEFLIFAWSNLTAEEICQRATRNKGASTGLAENRVIPMTHDQLLPLIVGKKVPGATQHLAALCRAVNIPTSFIREFDCPDPSLPYEVEITI